jgi:hypothetical protein
VLLHFEIAVDSHFFPSIASNKEPMVGHLFVNFLQMRHRRLRFRDFQATLKSEEQITRFEASGGNRETCTESAVNSYRKNLLNYLITGPPESGFQSRRASIFHHV